MPSMNKIALSALAAAGTAYAQCSVSATTTIQNQGDATGLASCTTFSGSIAVATGTTDPINLGGIRQLNGNLVANNNSAMQAIGASDMETINGQMNFNGLTRVNAVNFPKLKKVTSITWAALPNLGQIGFDAQVEEADSIDIQNTALKSLKGINIQEAKTIKVANNQYITEIKMQLGNVSTSLDFSDNNKALEVELTNLIWASNLTFRSCGSVALPSLEKLNGSLGFYNNAFENFAAPNLTEVGEALVFIGNQQLSNVSLPKVTKVNDDLRFANNTKLTDVDFLPSLESVGGAFDISGTNLTNVTTPKLDQVKGAFNIQSGVNITGSCPAYQELKDKKLIQGKFQCITTAKPSTEGTNSNAGSGSSSSNKEGAASTLSAVNGALGLAAMAAVFLI